VEELTYITLEPGNGGMILNVSEGGICFHAAIPILKTGTLHSGSLSLTSELKRMRNWRGVMKRARKEACDSPIYPQKLASKSVIG